MPGIKRSINCPPLSSFLSTHLVTLGCWIARLRCRLCTVDDCRGSPKTRSLQNKTTNQLAFQCVKPLPPLSFTCSHFSSFKTGCNLRVEMIVIDVRPVKQVIYFFFISLKLCNTEQYRDVTLKAAFPVPFMDIYPFFFLQYIPNQPNKYGAVINSFMHTFLIRCNKSCSSFLEEIFFLTSPISESQPPYTPHTPAWALPAPSWHCRGSNSEHVSEHRCWFNTFLSFFLRDNKG